MASTYSTNLKIELMGTGDQSGTWGNTTNTNLGTALEQAIVGYGNPVFATDADTSITLTDSNASQTARCLALNVTSSVSLSTTRVLTVPTVQKPYIVRNNTTGGQSITVKTSAGTGVTIPAGKYAWVYTDGTSVVPALDYLPTLALGTALPATSGGTGNSSYAVGDLLFASTTTALSKLADVATGNALISGGVGVAPSYGKIGLTTHVSGTLPVANGGTNQTSYTDGQLLIGNSTGNTLTKATLTAGTGISITNGAGSITIANGGVTSVGGTGTVNGITLTGTVTSTGNLTLGGTLSGVSLTTQVTGTLPIANGGTGTTSTTYCNLASNVTGTLPAANGGTGNASYAVGDLLYASTTTALSRLADVATGNALISGGVGVAPSWGKIGLTTHVSGTLPVANGGTGITSFGTGVATALGVNVGSAGAFVTNGGALGTPSGGTLTNATGLPLTTGVTGTLPVANGGTGLATITANNVILGNGTSAVQVVAPSTSGNVLQSNGTTWTSTAKITLATAQATTSGTSIEFTGIPSWVRRITVMFDAVSSNGTTDSLIIQLGSTTYTTSGYDSCLGAINGATTGGNSATNGFLIAVMQLASFSHSGSAVLTLMGSNTWTYTSTVRYTTNAVEMGAGRVALSGTLDRIKIMTSGADAFDAGSINIMYE